MSITDDGSSARLVDLRDAAGASTAAARLGGQDARTGLEPALAALLASAAESSDPELRRRASVVARRCRDEHSASASTSAGTRGYVSLRAAVEDALAAVPAWVRDQTEVAVDPGEYPVHGDAVSFAAGVRSAIEELAATSRRLVVELSELTPGTHSTSGPAVCLTITATGGRIDVGSAGRIVASLHGCTPGAAAGPIAMSAQGDLVSIASGAVDLQAGADECDVVATWPLDLG